MPQLPKHSMKVCTSKPGCSNCGESHNKDSCLNTTKCAGNITENIIKRTDAIPRTVVPGGNKYLFPTHQIDQ